MKEPRGEKWSGAFSKVVHTKPKSWGKLNQSEVYILKVLPHIDRAFVKSIWSLVDANIE